MEVKNCKGCGRLFNYMGGAPLCDACRKKLEEKFQKVKQYLDDHSDASPRIMMCRLNRSSNGSGKRDFHCQKHHLMGLPVNIAADRFGQDVFVKSVKLQWQIHSQTRSKNQSL